MSVETHLRVKSLPVTDAFGKQREGIDPLKLNGLQDALDLKQIGLDCVNVPLIENPNSFIQENIDAYLGSIKEESLYTTKRKLFEKCSEIVSQSFLLINCKQSSLYEPIPINSLGELFDDFGLHSKNLSSPYF